MQGQKNTVFVLKEPEALPHHYDMGWEYFLPGDQVTVSLAGGETMKGVVSDVMPDGSAVWIRANGGGRRLFGLHDGAEIRVTAAVPRPNIN
ncbi:hypothetical protein [Paenarthrobacter aurescens]|uniref:hypothetical protein n=1 Tax=Paenarthrobacter aurescens TaxID=43663 RepID=UPI0021C2067B|nr:hypothetical protein [Paenarthrobacter aurescens]MCT9870767.1 hypothetical protein [Paenarthrobacter aurescens]